MSVPPMMHLPKTLSPEEFELMCADVMPYLPAGRNLDYELYASRGEKQHGIDIKSKTELPNKKFICAQCKNYVKKEYKPEDFVKIIESDLKKAYKNFEIETFIIMTALDRSGVYQTEVDEHDWTPYTKPIVYYWEDIAKVILEHPALLKTYYPSFFYEFGTHSFGNTSGFFFNPDNNKAIEGVVSINPRYVIFERRDNNEVVLKAQMFICNGTKNKVRIKEVPYLALADDKMLLCEAFFDLSDKRIELKKGESIIYVFDFNLEHVFTNSLIIPNYLHCYWQVIHDNIDENKEESPE